MILASLYSVPAPGQRLRGETKFLGTVRTHMHKAPLTALASGTRERLQRRGIAATIRIIDMQTLGSDEECYGSLDYEGLILDKFRIGCTFESVADRVREDDVVGINANFTHSRRIETDFARFAKAKNPRALVVFGGSDATQDPEYFLRNGADVVVRGEAEITFELLLEAVSQKRDLATVPNLSFVRNGTVTNTPKRFLSDAYDVETMPPPDLGLVDLSKYTDTGEGQPPEGVTGPFISVETSRGCAQACTFCATPSTKGRYRYMKLERIREHFEYFSRMGVTTLLMQEDNILSRIHRRTSGDYVDDRGRGELLDLFRLAREMGFTWEFTNGIEFGQYARNGVIDHELIETMFWHETRNGRHRGCYRATIPLENLTDESSHLFRKLKPLGESLPVIRAIAQTGVHSLTFNLIIGRPQDDEHVLRLSYDRCREVRDAVAESDSSVNTYFNVYVLSLFPGTVDFRQHKHMLAFDLEKDPEVVTFYLACLRTPHFSPLETTTARGTLAARLNDERLIATYDETRFLTDARFEAVLDGRGPAAGAPKRPAPTPSRRLPVVAGE